MNQESRYSRIVEMFLIIVVIAVFVVLLVENTMKYVNLSIAVVSILLMSFSNEAEVTVSAAALAGICLKKLSYLSHSQL